MDTLSTMSNELPPPIIQNIVSTVNLGKLFLILFVIAFIWAPDWIWRRLPRTHETPSSIRSAFVLSSCESVSLKLLRLFSGAASWFAPDRRQRRVLSKLFNSGFMTNFVFRLASRKFARILQKLGFEVKFMDFKIQNMVGSCDMMFPISLESLHLAHAQFSSYEPELFPGLVYRMIKPRVCLLIFVSGKVVITGAKFREDIYQAFHQICAVLRGFRKWVAVLGRGQAATVLTNYCCIYFQ